MSLPCLCVNSDYDIRYIVYGAIFDGVIKTGKIREYQSQLNFIARSAKLINSTIITTDDVYGDLYHASRRN